MRVYNRTDEPIRLLGDQSVVVDPKGQSHPLRSRMIAPQSFVKLILPPLRPIVGPVGPTIGFGLGFGFGSGGYYRHGGGYRYGAYYSDFGGYGSPYYEVYDDGEGSYWPWPDNGSVRLVLTYQRGNRAGGPEAPRLQSEPATSALEGATEGLGPSSPPAAEARISPEQPGVQDTFNHSFVFRKRKA